MQLSPGFNKKVAVSTPVVIQGKGPLYGNGEQIFAQPHIAKDPLIYLNPDGIEGPPILSIRPGHMQLAALVGADGTITTDQRFDVKGAAQYVIDAIFVVNATAVPAAMTGGIYAAPSKGAAAAIIPATQSYAGLTGDPHSILKLTPDMAIREAPYLYLSLMTPNAEPIKFDILVYGYVTKTISD